VNGADRSAAVFAQIVDRSFDIFSSRTEGDENGLGVVGFVLGDEAVAASGQLGKLLVSVFKELKNRLGEVVAPATTPFM